MSHTDPMRWTFAWHPQRTDDGGFRSLIAASHLGGGIWLTGSDLGEISWQDGETIQTEITDGLLTYCGPPRPLHGARYEKRHAAKRRRRNLKRKGWR